MGRLIDSIILTKHILNNETLSRLNIAIIAACFIHEGDMMSLLKKALLGFAALAVTASVYASTTTISFFGGNNYVIGNKNAWTLEFLHFSEWKYGDNLFFFDVTNPHRDVTTISGEWSSRFSFSKITGKSISVGPISDVLFATELAVTGENMRQYGLGLGTDWKMPEHATFSTNAYWIHNDTYRGQTYQLAALWSLPFAVNDRFTFIFGGLVNYFGAMTGSVISSETGKPVHLKANLLFEPSLMLDLGHALNISSNKLYVGLQYAYWHNMLGTSLNQSVPELKLTWVL